VDQGVGPEFKLQYHKKKKKEEEEERKQNNEKREISCSVFSLQF
jgi:hypothetical protein